MKLWKYLTAASVFAGIWGCSESPGVAGNSAETGSPELAGLLYLGDGSPAAMARVRCVPSSFDARRNILPADYSTTANDSGAFMLPHLQAGSYSLEAFDQGSGEMLLVQNIEVPDSGLIVVSDTLKSSGYVLLNLEDESLEGSEGYASVMGTTILRSFKVEDRQLLVDSLPADSMDLILYLNEGEIHVDVEIPAADTVMLWIVDDSVWTKPPVVEPDTVILSYVASLALPEGADSLKEFSTDIPLVLRLDSSNCDFSDFEGLEGRWEVFRISADGSRSKSLSIAAPIIDYEAKTGYFWFNLDSLNVTDSVELVFNTSMEPKYARGVFPTNRGYSVVYHFDDGLDIGDFSEVSEFPGTGSEVASDSGVVGNGLLLSKNAFVEVSNSASTDSSRKMNLNYSYQGQMSFSAWVRLDNIKNTQWIMGKGNSQYDLRFSPDSGFVVEVFHQAEEGTTADTTNFKLVTYGGLDQIETCTWIYVGYSKNGDLGNLFVNGVKQEPAVKVAWEGLRDESENFKIGPFMGSIDELFVSGSHRTDAWTYATYLNQKPTDFWPVVSPRK